MTKRIPQTLGLAVGVCLAFSTTAALAADPAPVSFAGAWATSDDTFNTMHLKQDGDHVTGPYDFREGRAEGTVKDSTLDGVWAQSGSSQECASQKLGSSFWGRLQLHHEADGSLKGVWGYCDEDPSREFTAKKVKR
jgi:hypothetical protein